ncbi:MAG TPA: translation factor GTPase family protein [Symbiobacteriaceae bacterium]|nr:translation factor GTPase family protein [Symbiobacteriaceae bacterium]
MSHAHSAIRNVGLLAHVDAGKTTTTEQMLYLAGCIRAAGSVDEGTAQTDWLDVERERGISVRMASTVLPWQGCTINLVDTPGHVDFVAEVERSLRVMDGAVLIISAAEGVQAHTETLWHALRSLGKPTLLFVNKIDRIGVNIPAVLDDIRTTLTDRILPLQAVSSDCSAVTPLSAATLAEALADYDEAALERFLEAGTLEEPFLQERLAAATRSGQVFPVLFGASARGLGVKELLDAITALMPAPAPAADAPLAGVVFKLDRDPAMGRLAYVRLFGGSLRNRDTLMNATQNATVKVSQIRKMYARQHQDVGTLEAGDIAALCGLGAVRVGDVIGDPGGLPAAPHLATPVLSVRVHPANPAELPKLVQALQELTDEDPLLDVQWLPEVRELHLKVMGAIQIEVLGSLLRSQFGLTARFDPPTVIYKETPATAGEGFEAYTMPKPCWAILRFEIEPGPRDSGLQYASLADVNKLAPNYQREVERRVPEALQQGLKGWQVTDLKMTLTYGEHHIYHTHPLDFVVATPMAIMNGLVNTGTTLLEPIYAFRLTVPEHLSGKIIGDLIGMRAQFDSPVVAGGRFIVDGTLPVATSLDYPIRLASLSSGRGVITTRIAGYQPAPPDVNATRERVGVNPLDRAKYILSVRGAL